MTVCEFPLISKVWLLTEANLLGVWSEFMIIKSGAAYLSTKFATWYCSRNFASRLASSGISGFKLVATRLQIPILLIKLLVHVVGSRSNNLWYSLLLLATNAFAVALAATVFTTAPFFLNCSFFFYLGFLSRPFTNHRTAGEGGGHFFNSSLPLPLPSQTLRH